MVWAFVVFTSYRLVRPRERPRWHTAAGNVLVAVLCLVMTYPVVTAARNALAQADLVSTVFDDTESATTPEGRTKENPWAGTDRVNVLLLGGDGGEGRTGVRTDTVILVSMNTNTGKTVMFSLPRNMMNAQFPEDSPLHDEYPDGYTGSEDPAYYMLNAIYGQVPVNYPGILGQSDNEGADAIKQAVSGSLGVPVDYYVLVNLEGFKEIVDAMGGITVNINEPVAINGNTDAGIPPTDYLDPGPDQHLDGFHALWFARGRYGSDDYARMDRQRCTVDAIIDAANPMTLVPALHRPGQGREGRRLHRHPARPGAGVRGAGAQGQGRQDQVGRLQDLGALQLQRPRLRLDAGDRREGDAPAQARPEQAQEGVDERGRQGRLRLQPRRTTSSPASERRSYFEGSGTSHFTFGFTPR